MKCVSGWACITWGAALSCGGGGVHKVHFGGVGEGCRALFSFFFALNWRFFSHEIGWS